MNDESLINLFQDIQSKGNILLLNGRSDIVLKFQEKYKDFYGKLFYRVVSNCGGINFYNWIRLYGSSEYLDIVSKNEKIFNDYGLDIIIGEDVCGGLFGLKNNIVYYFAPDTLEWECLDIYYSGFLGWLIDDQKAVSQFYESFRFDGWEEYCSNIKYDQGISFYPQLCFKSDNERSRKIISMDEVIGYNFELATKFKNM